MPPHCDAMDGPVVKAALEALKRGNVDLVLGYVPAEAEKEVIEAFEAVFAIRDKGSEVAEVADLFFFETVVRLHRAGEGEPFTGLKPVGLDVGPVIPVAEGAIETGSPDALVDLLTEDVRSEVLRRFHEMTELQAHADESVPAARRYVSAMLGLQVWSHTLHGAIRAPAHGSGGTTHEHEEG